MKAKKVLSATEFKAKCLKTIDHLPAEGILILKRGKPVAKIIPVSTRSRKDLIGILKGKIKFKGDILSTGLKWNAQS